MKTAITYSIILFALISKGYAQNLFTTSYVEQAKVSPKAGILLGYQFASKHEIGVFYQKEVDLTGSQEDKPRFYEKEFLGVNVASQLISFNKLNMIMDVRIGVTNKTNFAITPSLKLDYEIIKRFHINGGVGIRSFNPTLQGGLRIDLY